MHVPIRPPRKLKTILTAVALTGLLVVLVPIWAVHRLVSGLLVRRPTGSRTPIERVAAADLDLDDVIARSRPLVISGLIGRLGLPLCRTSTGSASWHGATRPPSR